MIFKNDYLNETVGKVMASRKWGSVDKIYNENMHFFADTALKGGPCYYDMQHVKPAQFDFLWLHPCRTRYNKDGKAKKIFYNKWAFFDPSSPWTEVIDHLEMFEGYDTPFQRAKLVAEIGFVIGQKACEAFSQVQLGAFSVFTRRPFEFKGVRESFQKFMFDQKTKDLPPQWNMFVAQHLLTLDKALFSTQFGGWHNIFNIQTFPSTPLAYMTKKITPVVPEKSWKQLNTGFMRGATDKLFPQLYRGKRAPDWNEYETVDYSEYQPKTLISDSAEYNLKMYKELVKPYV